MKLKSISIRLTENYERPKLGEYKAVAELQGGSYNDAISVTVSPKHVEKIVAILAAAVAESMARAAGEFSDSVQAMIAGPAVEHVAIAASTGDDIPF